jgi:hypothetical protein
VVPRTEGSWLEDRFICKEASELNKDASRGVVPAKVALNGTSRGTNGVAPRRLKFQHSSK